MKDHTNESIPHYTIVAYIVAHVNRSHLPWTDTRWSPNIFLSSPSSTLSEAKLHRQLYILDSFLNLCADGSGESYNSFNEGGSGGSRGRM